MVPFTGRMPFKQESCLTNKLAYCVRNKTVISRRALLWPI